MYDPKSCCRAVFIALLVIESAPQAQTGFTVGTVAMPGDAVAVASELGLVYSSSLNDAGQVAFWADDAIFLQSGGTTSIVVGFGDSAPGGGTFIDGFGPILNASGQILFAADLAAPGRSGLFVWSEGSIQSIVQIGDPAPRGGTLTAIYEYSFNAPGDVAFSALTESGEGLFLLSQSTLSAVARAGDPAPRGDAFSSFYNPAINARGQIAFASSLDNFDVGIFLRNADSTITTVVRDGDPAPGGIAFHLSVSAPLEHQGLHPTGSLSNRRLSSRLSDAMGIDGDAVLYPDIYPAINDAGAVAFAADASLFNRGGIFLFSAGAITRQIRDGDPAPGVGFFSPPYFPSLNSSGAIAFTSLGVVYGGVFLLSGESVTEIVRGYQPSPEGDLFTYLSYAAPSVNALGQVTFQSELENSLGGTYLFSKGNITRIAGQGDPIDRAPKLLNAQPEAINAIGGMVFRGQSFPAGEELFDGSSGNPIARLGEPAPQGGVFDYFYSVAMNATQSIFHASTSSGAVGVYSRSNVGLIRIVGTGDPAPGGGVFVSIQDAAINNAGDVGFAANVSTGFGGVFVLSGGEFHALVRSGDPAPGGGNFFGFGGLSLNDAGQVAFIGYASPRSRYGVFLWSDGSVLSIAQTGDPAPGGGTFYIPGFSFPRRYASSLNAMGQVAFEARLSPQVLNAGVFLYSADGLRRIAAPGDPAPGGGTFARARWASLNDLGEVAFASSLSPSGFGVYLASQGTTTKIVGTGDPAPSGDAFSHLDVTRINSQGQVAFQGSTDLFSTNAVYVATPVR